MRKAIFVTAIFLGVFSACQKGQSPPGTVSRFANSITRHPGSSREGLVITGLWLIESSPIAIGHFALPVHEWSGTYR
jgi:hypothetical protein